MREITGYRIIDRQTGRQIGKEYSVKNRKRARTRVDKLDNEYGGYRYSAVPIFSN